MTTNKQDRKQMPMFRGLLQYFPDALAYVAHVSWKGNEQHNPGQPLHWAREKSTDHGDCIIRHQSEAGTYDDDGLLHDGKVAWRALAQLQLELEKRKQQAEAAASCGCSIPLKSERAVMVNTVCTIPNERMAELTALTEADRPALEAAARVIAEQDARIVPPTGNDFYPRPDPVTEAFGPR